MHAVVAWALALSRAPGGAVSDAEGHLWSGLANSRNRPGGGIRQLPLSGVPEEGVERCRLRLKAHAIRTE